MHESPWRRDLSHHDRATFGVLSQGHGHRRHDDRARLRTLAAAAYELAARGDRPVAALGADGVLLPLNAAAAELLATRELREHPRLRELAAGGADGRPAATTFQVRIAAGCLRVEIVPSSNRGLSCLITFHDDRHGEVARGCRLTNRERDVLCLIARGQTADAVARRLALSPRTVQKYLEHVYAKLGVNDRLSAVLRAQEIGILDRL